MNAKISILTFPQRQQGNLLYLNVLVIPRNFSPLEDNAATGLSPAWVNANLRLEARVINSLDDYPRLDLAADAYDLPAVTIPADAADLFNYLATQFNITSTAKADPPKTSDYVRKYLPQAYRSAFNFTGPRNPKLAELGDGYHCALKKNEGPSATFVPSDGSVSWGKVFAYCLRHPEVARKCGFIHAELVIELKQNSYKNGGWLYVDVRSDGSYATDITADPTFVKRYAARIPKLDLAAAEPRNLFAAVQFPVLINNAPAGDQPVQPSMFDELLTEATTYDDGFCKIVHANQPVSGSLLKEEQDEEQPVTNDIGIRLGWDDEQLLEWLSRQMSIDEKLAGTQRADAPLGVFQYRLDVRERPADESLPPEQDIITNPWTPLCRVRNAKSLVMGTVSVGNINEETELGVEVYPMKLDATPGAHFWLPVYFSQWNGKSLVIQDEDAIDIYKKDQNTLPNLDDPSNNPAKIKKAKKNGMYQPAGLENISLLYGHQYQFRVRMADTTGGGPLITHLPRHFGEAPVANCHFKRFVIPQTVQVITDLPEEDDKFYEGDNLSVKRPVLGYPSVVFTGKYLNAITDLKADADLIVANNLRRDVGLPDPDVDRLEVLVEVKCLDLDTTVLKRDPKDGYAILYKTTRAFSAGFNDQLDIAITYVDAPVLNFNGSTNLQALGLSLANDDIDDHDDIVLPTSRDVRITVRAICETREDYYGGIDLENDNLPKTSLKGMTTTFLARRNASVETGFFKTSPDGSTVNMIRGLYLQPDEPVQLLKNFKKMLVANPATDERIPDMIQRIASSIDADNKGMSLLGKRGERWQFGAARAIRHSLAPDNTSITFATKADLLNHWIVPITLLINRDWSWDGALPTSIEIYRKRVFVEDAKKMLGFTGSTADFLEANSIKEITASLEAELVGDVELRSAINITALLDADRTQTHVCFFDAVEPKQQDVTKFPDELLLHYEVKVYFKDAQGVAPTQDDNLQLSLHLPVTVFPAQVPKIVSAGLAMSKYVRDANNYTYSESRKKYLWVEFEEPVKDPNDAYYIRMLAYSPDPLLARWGFEFLIAPIEPALPIEPEYIRNISPEHSDDRSGLNAMQELVKAEDSEVHYLVPLPPGLHAESPELFGFFTCELRVGHKLPWCTAQARFGRAARHSGMQHPLPQLFCVAERNEKYIDVTAPYAQAVFDGRNITANPVRTQLWALLYAQVRMADNSDARNVLLDDRILILQRNEPTNVGGANFFNFNSDATPHGHTRWTNKEVEQMLAIYGLPLDSPLSVLCVEMMPGYDKFLVRQTDYTRYHGVQDNFAVNRHQSADLKAMEYTRFVNENAVWQEQTHEFYERSDAYRAAKIPSPLSDQLGNHRILRTSTLVPVPAVCCTE